MNQDIPASPEPARYAEALLELQSILDVIESDEVDLDDLSSKVERAAVLIRFCRERIEHTEMSIRQILDELTEESSD